MNEGLKKFADTAHCPVRNVISRFSSKWAMLILSVLAENGPTRFNAIGKALPDISPKVLTSTLKTLEEDRLVHREMFSEIPPRVEYSLTRKGESLIPILNSLIAWAIENR
ncbi:MAG: helix-turn-helix transcriptional regulator [Duncaniella sp.]|nr:helix-turn-helix transcriptional regulator [Duncaniella sp.]